jgi:opacity protein-like surface antigen
MKRTVIFLLALILCSKAFNQDSKLSLGIELSPTFSWLRGNANVGTSDSRIGYSAGLGTEYAISPQIAIKSGISYERKGSNPDLTMTNNSGEGMGTLKVKNNYDYLVVPVLVSFSTKGKVKDYFNAGPYVGYLISQKTIMGSFDNIPATTIDGTDKTKRIDFGLSLGCGLSIPVGDKLLFDLGLKGNFGLINTSKKVEPYSGDIKTNSIALLIGLKYKI